jgi:hypothetical protein
MVIRSNFPSKPSAGDTSTSPSKPDKFTFSPEVVKIIQQGMDKGGGGGGGRSTPTTTTDVQKAVEQVVKGGVAQKPVTIQDIISRGSSIKEASQILGRGLTRLEAERFIGGGKSTSQFRDISTLARTSDNLLTQEELMIKRAVIESEKAKTFPIEPTPTQSTNPLASVTQPEVIDAGESSFLENIKNVIKESRGLRALENVETIVSGVTGMDFDVEKSVEELTNKLLKSGSPELVAIIKQGKRVEDLSKDFENKYPDKENIVNENVYNKDVEGLNNEINLYNALIEKTGQETANLPKLAQISKRIGEDIVTLPLSIVNLAKEPIMANIQFAKSLPKTFLGAIGGNPQDVGDLIFLVALQKSGGKSTSEVGIANKLIKKSGLSGKILDTKPEILNSVLREAKIDLITEATLSKSGLLNRQDRTQTINELIKSANIETIRILNKIKNSPHETRVIPNKDGSSVILTRLSVPTKGSGIKETHVGINIEKSLQTGKFYVKDIVFGKRTNEGIYTVDLPTQFDETISNKIKRQADEILMQRQKAGAELKTESKEIGTGRELNIDKTITVLADDLLKNKIFTTKEEALSYLAELNLGRVLVKDAGERVIRLPNEVGTLVKVDKLSNIDLIKGKQEFFVLTLGKATKQVGTGLTIIFQEGASGRPINVQMGRFVVGKGGRTEFYSINKIRASKQILRTPEGEIIKIDKPPRFKEEQPILSRPVSRKVEKIGETGTRETAIIDIRKSLVKLKSPKSEIFAGELRERIFGTKPLSKKEFSTAFRKGLRVEKRLQVTTKTKGQPKPLSIEKVIEVKEGVLLGKRKLGTQTGFAKITESRTLLDEAKPEPHPSGFKNLKEKKPSKEKGVTSTELKKRAEELFKGEKPITKEPFKPSKEKGVTLVELKERAKKIFEEPSKLDLKVIPTPKIKLKREPSVKRVTEKPIGSFGIKREEAEIGTIKETKLPSKTNQVNVKSPTETRLESKSISNLGKKSSGTFGQPIKEIIKEETNIKSEVTPKISFKFREKQKIQEKQKELQKNIQKSKLEFQQIPKYNLRPSKPLKEKAPKPPEPTKIKPPKPDEDKDNKRRVFKDLRRKGDEFIIITGKGKKAEFAGKARTEAQAGIKLQGILKSNLKASAIVVSKRTGLPVQLKKLSLSREFEPSKKEPFRTVQKREFRLGTKEEVTAIQEAKRRGAPTLRSIR